ncbi:MAG: DEAD/DEAH box helicase [Chloroflexi bacterium]|nr:DEAD/DEAH box helicase [Chloroflexota bacterium]
MNPTNTDLLHSIQTGLVDQSIHSKHEYRPQFLINNNLAGIKVLSTLERELKNCDEFWFSVAFVTTSGLATIINRLKELEEKNVKGKILTSQYLNFTQPEALRRIKNFKNIELKIATEGSFHAKGYLFRKGENFNLIIGSSNLTADALTSNQEWNLKVTATSKSELLTQALKEFKQSFSNAAEVTDEFLASYEQLYLMQNQSNRKVNEFSLTLPQNSIVPNLMQKEALKNIRILRENHKTKALLISATGTGKTYLSAFDVQAFQPKTFLFVVHRQTIAREAMRTFKNLFGSEISMGFYSGNDRNLDADFIFCTIQTISRPEHLEKFDPNHFDYIVIDETHRAGADSYRQVMEYFKPKFLLGMTATPERTDGADIFKLFDYNIAYEIRLHQALSENMLSPFHYYGVTDLTIDNEIIDDTTQFNFLITEERVNRIIEKSKFYGTDDGTIRGLIFCSRKEECQSLAIKLNQRGYKTVALTGDDPEDKRGDAIQRLESDDPDKKLDYILTVDIFNEGVDIPKVNQIIMLRPTQSAIIFVQQLGRGLRKTSGKEYLTVIDFIGNYDNNYMVPIALYGDTTYNKDTLRNLLSSGSQLIPGSSTINFDQITKERIFASIDTANMQMRKALVESYALLKFKIGRVPMMMDFLEHGSRDPYLVAGSKKSYYNFVKSVESDFDGGLNEQQIKYLEYFTSDINNGKRVEESMLLQELMAAERVEKKDFQALIKTHYGYPIVDQDIESYLRNLNFEFITQNHGGKLIPVGKIQNFKVVEQNDQSSWLHPSFLKSLENITFQEFLSDTIQCSIIGYERFFSIDKYQGGFLLYKKYSRKDVFRILNWETNPLAQNVGGYMVSPDKSNCPIFVNYQKHENISSTTKYEDIFLNNQEFQYMSKSRRTLGSSDVQIIKNYQDGFRIPLFIKKSNDEGLEFYFMGDIVPQTAMFEQTTMPNDDGAPVSVVKMIFSLKHPVEDNLFEYLRDSNNETR